MGNRFINKNTLIELARIFQGSKKLFKNEYEFNDWTFTIESDSFYVIRDSLNREVVTFGKDGVVLSSEDRLKDNLFNFIDNAKVFGYINNRKNKRVI